MRRLAAAALVVALAATIAPPGACRAEERVLFTYPMFPGQPSYRIVNVDAAKREVLVTPEDRGGQRQQPDGPGSPRGR